MNQSDLNEIHNRITVCDAHCDLVDRLMKGKSELGIRSSMGHVDIPRMRKGGVDVQVFACCTYNHSQSKDIIEQKLSVLHSQFAKYSSHIELSLKLSEISKAERDKKLSGIFAIEGGDAIENRLDNLEMFHKLGVCIMTIAWKSNDWADASQQKMKHNGLTEFGKDVIREMNMLGMIIDISHSADKTVKDVLKISADPIIASHSNAKALCDHPRNLTDHLIKEVSSVGGVICVNFYPPFVRKYRAGDPSRPSFTEVVDHIEHIIKVGGIDSIGVGSDFDGIDKVVEGLEDTTKMPNITAELLKRGYLEEEITKIMGGNFLSFRSGLWSLNMKIAKIDIHIWIILILGIFVLTLKCMIVYPVAHIGHNDAMGYAEMADSIIHGKGMGVDYVSFHFAKYAGLPRPEDHWPPFYSFLIIPFYLILGKTAIAFKLPSLIISSIFLPIGTYAFAKKLSQSRWIGLVAGLTVMFYPKMFFWSLFSLSDITYTFIFLLVAFFAVKGFDDRRYFYLMGVSIAVGYYTKGSAILLIPAAGLFHFIRSWSLKAIFRDKAFIVAIVIAILLIAPFWVRNYVHFGNPLHSTQNNWAGNIGYSTDGPSNGNTYKVYWDKLKPTWTATKLPLGFSFIAKKSWEYFDTQFQWAFVNMGNNEPFAPKSALLFRQWRSVFRDFPKFPTGIPIGILGFPALLGLIFLRHDRNICIIPIFFGSILLFLSITWAPIDRLILISVPLVIALGWTSYYHFLKWCLHFIPVKPKWLGFMVRITPYILLSLLASAIIIYDVKANYASWQNGKGGNVQERLKISIDEVRVYDKALSPDEVMLNYDSVSGFVNDGLISYWSFDKDTISGIEVSDPKGGNDGIIIGHPEIVEGKSGEALYFDGDDCIQIPAASDLNLRDSFTIETWVKGDNPPQEDTVKQWLSKGGNYVFSWNHSKAYVQSIAFFDDQQQWPAAKIMESLRSGEWYHVVGTWDGISLKIYLNGKLSNETLSESLPSASDVPLRIGNVEFGGGWFPYADGVFEREQLLLANWIRENTPQDAVIMDCDPWALQFYSDRKTVHFACDSVEEIIRVMRHYGVTYITYDTYEAAHPKTLDDYYSGKISGFEPVYSISNALKLYLVRYELLPPDLMKRVVELDQ